MDTSLTQFVNSFCGKLAVTPARLHPHEIYMTSADLSSEQYTPLQGKSVSCFHPIRLYIYSKVLLLRPLGNKNVPLLRPSIFGSN